MIVRQYRGQRIDNGEWVYGEVITVNGRKFIKPINSHFKNCVEYGVLSSFGVMEQQNPSGWIVEVDHKTIGQEIGLEDVKKKNVFKGDKVVINYARHHNDPKGITNHGTVIYDKKSASYKVAIKDSKVLVPFSIIHVLQKIGTIHDKKPLNDN